MQEFFRHLCYGALTVAYLEVTRRILKKRLPLIEAARNGISADKTWNGTWKRIRENFLTMLFLLTAFLGFLSPLIAARLITGKKLILDVVGAAALYVGYVAVHVAIILTFISALAGWRVSRIFITHHQDRE